jgi:chemotaxis signal transduction protein
LKKKYLTGLGKKDDRIIMLLNIDFLLTSEEKIMLKESEDIFEKDEGTEKPS